MNMICHFNNSSHHMLHQINLALYIFHLDNQTFNREHIWFSYSKMGYLSMRSHTLVSHIFWTSTKITTFMVYRMKQSNLGYFPYTLWDRAREWLDSLLRGINRTWNDLTYKFVTEYFLPTKATKLNFPAGRVGVFLWSMGNVQRYDKKVP